MNLGKWLIYIGLGIFILGILIWLGSKIGIPFGKLPGDIHVERGKSNFYFPIVTCIVISVLLTLLLNFFLWIFRK
jgi:DUF2905 family protein